MTDEELVVIADRVKNGDKTLTEEEILAFTQGYAEILSYLNKEIKKEVENEQIEKLKADLAK